ncbi:GH92 family glycosyl hydrolase [Oleiharenicola lentus]|uniref:GH92 family glycosyl hydrolase n=1 Tax=Oleiharenicola lentus TaxID=2508720 RepID=UPI003F66AA82
MKSSAFYLSLLLVSSLALPAAYVEQVDPFLGTAAEGNVYPGATLPFGFIQVSPDTGPGSMAGGYKFDRNIVAFSQQHISGMGGPILGEISVFPATGEIRDPANIASTGKSAEAATPGYYTVTLAPWNVKIELTATSHMALHRHTFPARSPARVLVDVGHCLYGQQSDKPRNWGSAYPTGGEVRIDRDKQEVSGYMVYQAGRSTTKPWKVYFVARFDTPFASAGTWNDDGLITAARATTAGKEIGACLDFDTTSKQVVQTKIAVSWRSLDQARGYLDAQSGWDFDAVKKQARDTWEQTLSAIKVEGGTTEERTKFYTALYRAHLTPNNWTNESPDRYGSLTYYENLLCLWDTFRTVNPLFTLIQPKINADIVNSIINYHRIDGWTGDAHSAHQYEHVQNGSHADTIIADAYVKELPGIDWSAAYAAIRKNAFEDPNPTINERPVIGRFRLNDYLQHQYLPTDVSDHKDVQAVSRTLEYVHNDFSVYTLAKEHGSPGDIKALEDRITWYRHLWDANSGFMRGKKSNGDWLTPFDPLQLETGRQYYEGHAWTWSWYVPHDPQGLINLMGGDEAFIKKLTIACENYYEAFNEPCMLETYLFIHGGRPDLTQRFVREAQRHFTTSHDGLPGNDDSGTTSAWLVWTMLGIYPNAGQDYYYVGSPVFSKATIRLGNGKEIILNAPATSADARYIASAKLNGRPLGSAWFRHGAIKDGATFDFTMTTTPTNWGRTSRPPSWSAPDAK